MFSNPNGVKLWAYLHAHASRKDMQKTNQEKRPDAGNTRPPNAQWTMKTSIMRKTAWIGNDALHLDISGGQNG